MFTIAEPARPQSTNPARPDPALTEFQDWLAAHGGWPTWCGDRLERLYPSTHATLAAYVANVAHDHRQAVRYQFFARLVDFVDHLVTAKHADTWP